MGRRVALLAMVAVLSVGVAVGGQAIAVAQPAAGPSAHYVVLARAKAAGQPVGCVDVHWAAQQGLLAPVEVRWLAEVGLVCPDGTVDREHIPSEQYVVMLALGARGQLACGDLEWNARHGHLTWSALVNLLGVVVGCGLTQYAKMVALGASGQLTCDDVYWNYFAGWITKPESFWLVRATGCDWAVIEPPLPPLRWLAPYQVGVLGDPGADVEEFRRQVAETLSDPRGWRRAGVGFQEVAEGGAFTLWLAQDVTMGAFGCGSTWSCTVGSNVVVNATRWREASPSWNAAGGALRDYRHLVVNHEVGHWLGLGHLGCPGQGGPAAVMQQQSIDLGGCAFNPWPLDSEVAAVP